MSRESWYTDYKRSLNCSLDRKAGNVGHFVLFSFSKLILRIGGGVSKLLIITCFEYVHSIYI